MILYFNGALLHNRRIIELFLELGGGFAALMRGQVCLPRGYVGDNAPAPAGAADGLVS